MDVAGIGVQTITPTTGTTAQNPNPAPPDRADESDKNDSARVTSSSASDTGKYVDKLV